MNWHVRHRRFPWGGHEYILVVPFWIRPMRWFNRASLWLTGTLFGYARYEFLILERSFFDATRTRGR